MAENDSNGVTLKGNRKLIGNQSVNVLEVQHLGHCAFRSNLYRSHGEGNINDLWLDGRSVSWKCP